LKRITRQFEDDFGVETGGINLIGPTEWHWPTVYSSSLILTFSSSAVYELWASGLSNVFVCNFLETSRSSRLNFFQDIFLDSHTEFLELLDDRNKWDPELAGLTALAAADYRKLFDGNATQHVYEELQHALESHVQ